MKMQRPTPKGLQVNIIKGQNYTPLVTESDENFNDLSPIIKSKAFGARLAV